VRFLAAFSSQKTVLGKRGGTAAQSCRENGKKDFLDNVSLTIKSLEERI